MTSRSHTFRRKQQDPPKPQALYTCAHVCFLTMLPVARIAQVSTFQEYLFVRDVEGSGVLEGLTKTINNSSHNRRCPGRDSNRELPNTEHECCRLRSFVSRGNTFLLFNTSRPRTSKPHNLMLNIFKSSSALKSNLKTLCNCSNGTQ